MKGEIVRIITDDGLHLEGMLCEPPSNGRDIALVHCHGFGGNFYGQPFLDFIAADVTARGYTFLSINTRGHDYLTSLFQQTSKDKGEVTYGAAVEQFGESSLDLAAWLDFIEAQGFNTVALEGHSRGSIKTAHYQAQRQDERVKTVILISPPDLLGLHKAAPKAVRTRHLEVAERMVAEGRATDLVPDDVFPYPEGAGAYLSFFRPGSKAAVFNFHDPDDTFETVGALRQPILGVMGTVDEPVMDDPGDCMAVLEAKAVKAPYCQTVVIQGADHSYYAREHLLASTIGDWLDRVF